MATRTVKPSDELLGAAFHEAGHVVVAKFLGLHVSEVEIGMGGDDASGRAKIGCADQLSFIDQIALCAAGLEAQEMFDAPTHKYGGFGDYERIVNLVVGLSEADSFTLRNAGYLRASEILNLHRSEVEKLAKRLMREKRVQFS
jgi:hypothetical protein